MRRSSRGPKSKPFELNDVTRAYLKRKIEVLDRLKDFLAYEGFSFKVKSNDTFDLACEIGRFRIRPYYRPLSELSYNERLEFYRGPHIPIFASDRIYEDTVINYTTSFKYKTKNCFDFHFMAPQFVLFETWPKPTDWLWCPPAFITKSILLDLLHREVETGGWPKNSRGRVLIPYSTGVSGLHRTTQAREGWSNL